MNKKLYICYMNKDRLKEVFKSIDSNIQSNQTLNDRVLIVDGTNTFMRCFSAIPALNDNGDHVGAVIGFLKSVGANIKTFAPTRCIVVFDGKGGSVRRRKVYPDYKQNRKTRVSLNRYSEFESIDDERESFRKQFVRLIEYLEILPVTVIGVDNIEADDTIAYICDYFRNKKKETNKITIVSTDKDFLQLTNDDITIYNPIKKKAYTRELIFEEFGILSDNFLLYRTIDGDKSDNIPGINGVGIKTLNKLFNFNEQVYTFESFYNKAKELQESSKLKALNTIVEGKEILDRNYKLMQLEISDIAPQYKEHILGKIEQQISRVNILEFRKMFDQDRLYSNIKYVDRWLQDTFRTLDVYAK